MSTIDLGDTFGALYIGIFFSAVLLGVTLAQGFYYFQNYGSDSWAIKTLVAALLIMETAKSAFGAHAVYYYVVLNYFNPAALSNDIWSLTMTQGISTPIIFLVHVFYLRRVYHLSRKNIPLVAITAVLVVVRCGMSFALTSQFFRIHVLEAAPIIIQLGDAIISTSVVLDMIFAVSLSYYLHTSRSGVRSTDTLINKLMIYTINNGILTSVFDILVLATMTAQPNNLVFFGIYQVVANLYTNSMMATLNSRKFLAQSHQPSVSGGTHHAMNRLKLSGTTATSVSAQEGEGRRLDGRDEKPQLVLITTSKDVLAV